MEIFEKDLIEIVEERLKEGKKIRRFLPDSGVLHIDRPLPFLFVFRIPTDGRSTYLDRIVRSEACYLIISGKSDEQHMNQREADRVEKETRFSSGSKKSTFSEEHANSLVFSIIKTLSKKFKAFLLVEIWLGPAGPANGENPHFKIFGPQESLPATVKTLKSALCDMQLMQQEIEVEVSSKAPRHPVDMPPLLHEEELKAVNCLSLGIEVSPFFINQENGLLFPGLFQLLKAQISKAFKKTVFDFVRIQTPYKVKNYQMLGKQSVLKTVWQIDQQLIDIDSQFKFLLLVTPINTDEEWEKFKKGGYQKMPNFLYRLLPVDTEELKRQLYNIPIEKVDDPTFGYLFRDKRREIDRMLTMLEDRETENFLYGSLQVYGGVKDGLLRLAETILNDFPENSDDESKIVDAEAFAFRAHQELSFLREQYPELDAEVQIRPDVVGLMVSEGNLLIGRNARIPQNRVEALIQHEVGTHILTYFNGKAQPLKQLYSGVPGYEELQEGLAVLSEYLVNGLTSSRMRTLAARVVAIRAMLDGADFIQAFRLLHGQYGFSPYSAFTIVTRVFRSGGFTKDAVYLRGLVSLLEYLKKGNNLETMLIGKIRQDYIPIMEELIYRNVLKPIPLKPRYLSNPEAEIKLKILKQGVNVYDLLEI